MNFLQQTGMRITCNPNTFSIFITGDSVDELKKLFDKLAEGADKDTRTYMELRDMPFGTYGQFTDKFGVSWIFRGPKKD